MLVYQRVHANQQNKSVSAGYRRSGSQCNPTKRDAEASHGYAASLAA